jgi:hypothetical protein
MGKHCGNCNLQGGSKADSGGSFIYCLYDNEYHRDTYVCDIHKPYNYGMGDDARREIARSIRESNEGERRHQENLIDSTKKRKSQKTTAIVSFIIGCLVTFAISYYFYRKQAVENEKLIQRTFELENRPELHTRTINLNLKERAFEIIVKNYGEKTADNVNLKWNNVLGNYPLGQIISGVRIPAGEEYDFGQPISPFINQRLNMSTDKFISEYVEGKIHLRFNLSATYYWHGHTYTMNEDYFVHKK